MHKTISSLFLLLLIPCLCFSEENQTFPDMRLGANSEPLTSVYNCVNVVTGDFFLSDNALQVNAVVPLRYNRSYDTGDGRENPPQGRGFGTELPLKIHGIVPYKTVQNVSECKISIEEQEGASVIYKGRMGSGFTQAVAESTSLNKHGYTNYATAGIPGCDCIKKRTIDFTGYVFNGHRYDQNGELYRANEILGGTCQLKLGSGGLRTYYNKPGYQQSWRLNEERLPNGHRIFYEYDQHGDLSRMRATNPSGTLTFSTIDINNGRITSSDGQTLQYDMHILKCHYKDQNPSTLFVKSITSPDGVTCHLHYNYVEKKGGKGRWRKLLRIDDPDRTRLQINYGEIKVSQLLAPAGQGNALVPIASFAYAPAHTDVYDALGARTTYHFTPEKRITAIWRMIKHQVLSKTCFFWETNEPHQGYLLAKGVATADDRFLYCSVATYDRGNIVQDDLYGNLTGNAPPSFKLNGNHRPNEPTECFSRYITYSTDGFNLALHEQTSDGLLTDYSYLPNTNLVTSILNGNSSGYYHREFRSYSNDHLLTETIVDDGISANPNDLTGVTSRTFTAITPRLEGPAIGFPKTTIEGYIDLQTGDRKQLKRIEHEYNNQNLLTRQIVYDAEDIFAYSLQFAYDAKRNLVEQTDALGQVVRMRYDIYNNKIEEEHLNSGFRTTFTYDAVNRLIKTEEHHSDGTHLAIHYAYDLVGNKISETDRYGNLTRFQYDTLGNQIAVIYPETEGRAEQQRTVRKEYNQLDQLTAVIDQNGNRTTTTYNVRGQPVCICYPDGSEERNQYHLNGTVEKKWEKEGLCHHYIYDGCNRVVETQTSDTNGKLQYRTFRRYRGAQLISETDPMGVETKYAYDGAGRKVLEVKGNQKTTYSYDSLGRLSITKQWSGESDYIAQIQCYDTLDRFIELRTEDAYGTVFSKETYAYDRLGNQTLTTTYDSESTYAVTQTHFNSQGQATEQVDALGNVTHITYCDKFYEKTITDPLGNIQHETYDALHRVIKIEKRNPFGITTALQTFGYDAVGNKNVQRETVFVNGAATHDYIIRWEHDSMGRVVYTSESGGDELTKTTLQCYDRFGRLLTITKPDGITLRHTYDSLGHLQTLVSSDGTISYSYAYDLNSNLLQSHDLVAGQTTTRQYDTLNHLVGETLATGLTSSYLYDSLGHIEQVHLPDTTTITYTYEGPHLKSVSRSDYTHIYRQHDWRGCELQSQLIGNAGTRHCNYDALERLSLSHTTAFTEEIPNGGYDSVGNLVSATVRDNLGATTGQYRYSDLNQLISETGSTTHTYQYDSIDNRVLKDNATYRISRLNQVLDDSETIYRYDLNGNLLQKTVEDQVTRYTYDALNRLTAVETPTLSVTYTYDSFGRRLSKQTPDLFETYLYQGQREIGAMTNGVIAQLRVLGSGKGAELGAAIAIELNGILYASLHDHRGNICTLLDAQSGQVAGTYRYSAFGELAATEGIACPWGFASKRFDAETGFIYFGKRYYSPSLGRWITPDPIGFTDGPNLYAYVHNNPMCMFDAYGLSACGIATAGSSESHRSRGASYPSGCMPERLCKHRSSFRSAGERFRDFCIEGKNHWDQLHPRAKDFAIIYGMGFVRRVPYVGPTISITGVMLRFGRTLGFKNPIDSLFSRASRYSTETGVRFSRVKDVAQKVFKDARTIQKDVSEAVIEAGKTKRSTHGYRFRPEETAEGAHTVFKRNPKRDTFEYETYQAQTNPHNPNPWETVKRFDQSEQPGKFHYNKATDTNVYEPHVHDPTAIGGVRIPELWEIPLANRTLMDILKILRP